MSLTRPTRQGRSKLLIFVMAFCAVGACLNFVGLGFALNRIGNTAAEGQKARVTQCTREPVYHKLILAGRHYRLLNDADVRHFEATSPNCTVALRENTP